MCHCAFVIKALRELERARERERIYEATGADAIKKFTPSLGIPYLGV
jgi:hypothetical protein